MSIYRYQRTQTFRPLQVISLPVNRPLEWYHGAHTQVHTQVHTAISIISIENRHFADKVVPFKPIRVRVLVDIVFRFFSSAIMAITRSGFCKESLQFAEFASIKVFQYVPPLQRESVCHQSAAKAVSRSTTAISRLKGRTPAGDLPEEGQFTIIPAHPI